MSNNQAYERGEVPVSSSGWTKPQGLARAWPTLADDVSTDVVVIGAGLAGASVALHLAEAGVGVTVLEARQPGWGASGRNAGHVLPILRDMKVLERFPDGGERFLELFREHHTIPFDLSVRHGIDCDAVRSGYINGMKTQKAFDAFVRTFSYLERKGLQRLTPVTDVEMKARIGSDAYPYGVIFENGGRVNPYLFTNGMIAAAARLGARIHGESEALALEPAQGRWRVRTRSGSVLADRVIFCTAAYPAAIEPAFRKAFYPLTAYALTTKPLPPEALDIILPGGGTFAQVPIDLNPMVRDRHNRLILSSIPRVGGAQDAAWHFRSQMRWLRRVWPEARGMEIEMEDYWTGRVAMRKAQFPGVFELANNVFGLMYFNAWGNVMAPLMGKIMADALARDAMHGLPFPLEKPEPVSFNRKYEVLIRHLMLPAARVAQRWGVL